jgi:hypothetical protein
VKAPPQLVFRLYAEAEHLSAGRSTPPRDVIDKLDLRVGRRYRYKVHWSIAARHALRVRRRAGPTSVRPSSWHRYRRSIPRGPVVLLWSVLENAGAPVTVRGFGMLFDDRQPDGNKTEER